jgi:NAD(P)-dependent dehydrogenase (short-subunit alcohol dehydrogenase family)
MLTPAGLFDLNGKVALVTGAQRGIGEVIARQLVGAGAEVVINHIEEDERAAALEKELCRGAGKAWSLKFDVTDSRAVSGGFEEIVARAGRLDILVNNAGMRLDGLALRMKDEQWRRAIAVNLDGVFYCCRAARAEASST